MRSAAHDQTLSFGALFTKSQEVKKFEDQPPSDTGIDEEGIRRRRMTADARKPRQDFFAAETAYARGGLQPKRLDVAHREKPIGALALVQRHENPSSLPCVNITATIPREQLAALDALKVGEPWLHDKMIALVDGVVIADFHHARRVPRSLCELRPQHFCLGRLLRAEAAGSL